MIAINSVLIVPVSVASYVDVRCVFTLKLPVQGLPVLFGVLRDVSYGHMLLYEASTFDQVVSNSWNLLLLRGVILDVCFSVNDAMFLLL